MTEPEEFMKTIMIPSRIEKIGEVLEEFRAYFKKKSYSGVKYRSLQDAIYEAVSNAIIHGNKRCETKRIWVTFYDFPDTFQVKVTDEGEGFEIHSIPDPRSPDNIMKPNGRGLLIIKNSVDELRFDEKGKAITMVIHK